MKTLIIVRHAKSSWKDPNLDDFDRPLNRRGKQAAPEMGRRLKARGCAPQLLISSPAKRARKTAQVLAEELGYPQKKIVFDSDVYEASNVGLVALLRNIDASIDEAMLVGHNPSVEALSRYLSGTAVEKFPTAAASCISLDIARWDELGPGTGRMVFFDYPRKPQP